ncbi:hypothetical protein JP74_11835 [Devosia sp. 17-2-E-8]|nr:hypothetical protein JP74_11835 [Devosia sp. 17-2-E-8]
MRLTRWQRLRSRVFLFAVGLKRRMTFGVRVMLIDDNKIFLIRHTYMPGWQLPGGGVEPGESAEESAAHEVFEEGGLKVTGPLELFGIYHNVSSVTNRDHVALFLCRQFEQAVEFRRSFEIAEAGWFPLDALPDGLSPATTQRVAEVFGGEPRSGVWGVV